MVDLGRRADVEELDVQLSLLFAAVMLYGADPSWRALTPYIEMRRLGVAYLRLHANDVLLGLLLAALAPGAALYPSDKAVVRVG